MSPATHWIQLRLSLSAAQIPEIEESLFEAGAQSIAVDDDGFDAWIEVEPGETSPWRSVRLTALFDASRTPEAILEALRGTVDPEVLASARFERLQDRDWSRVWMERWKPQRFGRRLWICPTWEAPPEPGAINLRLDPGSAFGTGSHATTALCLEWLDSRNPMEPDVLDYGCGSGVLAVAALRLGARQAWACDVDRTVLQVVQENARRNGVASRMWIGHSTELPPLQVDVIVANILSRTLVQLVPRLSRLHRPGGSLALSGILEEQVPEVVRAYELGYAMRRVAQREGWVLLEGTRRGATSTRSAGTPPDPASPP